MWEVMSYGERPYWDMTNQDVCILFTYFIIAADSSVKFTLQTFLDKTSVHTYSFDFLSFITALNSSEIYFVIVFAFP